MSDLHTRAFPNARDWSAAEFETLLEKPTTHLSISAHGMALGQLVAPDCDLLFIAIDPAQQGKGHGKALLSTFLEQIRKKGATRCILEVNSEDHKTIDFYYSAGFHEINRLKAYYTWSNGSKTDACIMERRLSSV